MVLNSAAAPGRSFPMRRDAARSRRAILDAATRLFAERGEGVPMYEVARTAGVGQATLYRHFPDRSALVSAILLERIEALEALAAAHADDPDGVVILLRTIARQQADSSAIIEIVRADVTVAPGTTELAERISRIVTAPIAAAVDAGRIRRDFTTEDFMMMLGMVNGTLRMIEDADQRAARVERVLDIALTGILR